MNNFKRPYMLTGLIISLLTYIGNLVVSGMGMVVTAGLLGGFSEDPVFMFTYILTMGIFVIIAIFSLLGIIFSGIGIARNALTPQELQNKKGLIVTVVVFNFLVSILIFISLASSFDIVSLLFAILALIGAIFIIVDLVRNKKQVEKEKQAEQIANIDNNQSSAN